MRPRSPWYKNPDSYIIAFLFGVSALASCLELGWRAGLMAAGGVLFLPAMSAVLLSISAGMKGRFALRPDSVLIALYALAYGGWVLSTGHGKFLMILSALAFGMAVVVHLVSLGRQRRRPGHYG